MDDSPFQLVGAPNQGSAPSSSSGSQVGDGTSSLAAQGDLREMLMVLFSQ